MADTQARLKRAAKLTTGLADEQVRWAESVEVSCDNYRSRLCHYIFFF